MTDTILKQTQRSSDMLANISRAVAIILWVVLTQAIVWPVASVYSGYMDQPILDTNTLLISSITAMAIAFGVTRWVFPISYERVPATEIPDDDS